MAAFGMPQHMLVLFQARPPLPFFKPVIKKKPKEYSGLSDFLHYFETGEPPAKIRIESKLERKEKKKREKVAYNELLLKEKRKNYNPFENKDVTTDPKKTLFIGRLSYDITEKTLRKEFEIYGKLKTVKIIHDLNNKPRGYAFIEYEHSKSLNEAYNLMDGKKIDNRRILVDIERSRIVKNWYPRRLGGGKGPPRGSEEKKKLVYNVNWDALIQKDRYKNDKRKRSSSEKYKNVPLYNERNDDDARSLLKRERRYKDGSRSEHKEKERKRDSRSSHSRSKRIEKEERDRDREKDRDRDRDREKNRDRDRERDRNKERDKDRDRDRDTERGRDRSKERDNDRERDREKNREKQRSRGNERDINRNGDYARHRDRQKNDRINKKKEADLDRRDKYHYGRNEPRQSEENLIEFYDHNMKLNRSGERDGRGKGAYYEREDELRGKDYWNKRKRNNKEIEEGAIGMEYDERNHKRFKDTEEELNEEDLELDWEQSEIYGNNAHGKTNESGYNSYTNNKVRNNNNNYNISNNSGNNWRSDDYNNSNNYNYINTDMKE